MTPQEKFELVKAEVIQTARNNVTFTDRFSHGLDEAFNKIIQKVFLATNVDGDDDAEKEHALFLNMRSKLMDVEMPDRWLADVAHIEDLSPAALMTLAAKLKRNGFASVIDALNWLQLEEAYQAKSAQEKAKEAQQAAIRQRPGAQALLDRALGVGAPQPGVLKKLGSFFSAS